MHRKNGPGILGRVTDSLQNLTTTYLVRQRSPEFDSVKDYVNTFGEKLNQMEKVGRRLQKERQGNIITTTVLLRNELVFSFTLLWFFQLIRGS